VAHHSAGGHDEGILADQGLEDALVEDPIGKVQRDAMLFRHDLGTVPIAPGNGRGL